MVKNSRIKITTVQNSHSMYLLIEVADHY